MKSMEIITGVERRRRFTDDEKIQILAEARQPGHTMLATARKYGVSNSLLYEWQNRLKKNSNEAPPPETPSKFVRVSPPTKTNHGQFIRLSFAGGFNVELPLSMNVNELARLIQALRE